MSNKTHGPISFSVLSIILLSLLLFLFPPQPLWSQNILPPRAPALSILGYQLVSSTRVNSTVWAYSYTATVRASGGDFYGASATVTSSVPTTVVTSGTVHFGNVFGNPPNLGIKTSVDTFTLQIDRRYPLHDSDLSWTFKSADCTPPDICHIFNDTWDPVTGCGFTDLRWNMGLGDPSVPGDQRYIWDHGNSFVDLYSGAGCNKWNGISTTVNVPNDCGPVAGVNLLNWYDMHPNNSGISAHLPSEMHTNNWGSETLWDVGVDVVCGVKCAVIGLLHLGDCISSCTSLVNDKKFYNAGTLPDDFEYALRLNTPPGYLLYRSTGQKDVTYFGYLLGQGNPVAVLIWTGSQLHWTVVTGTEVNPNPPASGSIYNLRFANYGDDPLDYTLGYSMPWDTFSDQWSLGEMNWLEEDIVGYFDMNPYLEMHYQVTTKLLPGQKLTRGAEQTCSSFPCDQLVSYESTWQLILDGGGNLVLYPNPIPLPCCKGTWDSGTANTDAQTAIMQTDGNFVIYDSQNNPLWASQTSGNPGAYLALQNDGRLRIWSADNTTMLWEAKLAH